MNLIYHSKMHKLYLLSGQKLSMKEKIMRFNKQKAELLDLDYEIAKIMVEQQKTRFEDVWEELDSKWKDNSTRGYVKERLEDYNDII
jgi:hypothetical protein